MRKGLLALLPLLCPTMNAQTNTTSVVFQGKDGPGAGKHIVFLAS